MAFGESNEYLRNHENGKGSLVKVVATQANGSSDLFFIDVIVIQKNKVD